MLNINYPIELAFTIRSGKYVPITLTYTCVVPPSHNWDDPPDDYYGYTDVEYVYTMKLNTLESADLDHRVKRYVERLCDMNYGKHWEDTESYVYDD